ncbi:MAG: pyridoxamine 5'-phosphate oxidase family protein [Nitratireductor sp.]|jgi:general stress protein 26|nr:pyridoxamine 5'-phosphate oxidase family protein [Nitratireductor sp.]
MADLEQTRTNPKEQLWDVLESVNGVMLGSGGKEHMQPMSPNVARDEERIWFFTRNTTDIAKAAEKRPQVHLCVIGNDHDYHACIRGTLAVSDSPEHIERFWNPVSGAWFDGKDDPELTMLVFTPVDAAIWASTGSSVRFGWEVLAANVTDREPDMGERASVTFAVNP